MKKSLLMLFVFCVLVTPVAADLTFVFGDDFSGVEIGRRLGCFEIGSFVGVDYFSGGNNLEHMDVDTGGNLAGPNLKLHLLPDDYIVDPFIATSWIFRNGVVGVHDGIVTFEAGAMVRVWKDLKIGASWITSDDIPQDDYLMIRVSPLEF